MIVSRINRAPKYSYCIQFEHVDVHTMYDIADWVTDNQLPYWVGALTHVVHVPHARDVTWVRLMWADHALLD